VTGCKIEAEYFFSSDEFENIFLDIFPNFLSSRKTVKQTFSRRRAIDKFVVDYIAGFKVISLAFFRFIDSFSIARDIDILFKFNEEKEFIIN
jgi:hypothetical protein